VNSVVNSTLQYVRFGDQSSVSRASQRAPNRGKISARRMSQRVARIGRSEIRASLTFGATCAAMPSFSSTPMMWAAVTPPTWPRRGGTGALPEISRSQGRRWQNVGVGYPRRLCGISEGGPYQAAHERDRGSVQIGGMNIQSINGDGVVYLRPRFRRADLVAMGQNQTILPITLPGQGS